MGLAPLANCKTWLHTLFALRVAWSISWHDCICHAHQDLSPDESPNDALEQQLIGNRLVDCLVKRTMLVRTYHRVERVRRKLFCECWGCRLCRTVSQLWASISC